MKQSLVTAVSGILRQLDFSSRKKPRIQSYVEAKKKDEFAWLTEPQQPRRNYDSSLSSPGRLCPNRLCRRFVSGKPKECPSCRTSLLSLLMAILCFTSSAGAQLVWPWGTADSSVREFLAASWDTANVNQNERGYCAMFTVRDVPFDPNQGVAYRLYELRLIMPMASDQSNPESIVFACPDLPNVVRVHVHPQTTCSADGKCQWGGQLAWQCEPSPQDFRLLIQEGQAFGVLQCDRHALTFWGFKDFRPKPAKQIAP
jgi:hypothetical protein